MNKICLLIVFIIVLNTNGQNSYKEIDSLIIKGRYSLALKKLEELPSSFRSNLKKATIYESVDYHKKASHFYKQGIMFKEDYGTKIKLGKSLRKQKKIKEAMIVFDEVYKKDSNNLYVSYTLGKLYLQQRKVQKAKPIFKKLIKKDAKNPNYYYQLV